MSLAGQLILDGTPGPCPGRGTGRGFLTERTAESLRHRVVGRFPSRGLVWDWGEAPVVLLEQRHEAIIHLPVRHRIAPDAVPSLVREVA